MINNFKKIWTELKLLAKKCRVKTHGNSLRVNLPRSDYELGETVYVIKDSDIQDIISD